MMWVVVEFHGSCVIVGREVQDIDIMWRSSDVACVWYSYTDTHAFFRVLLKVCNFLKSRANDIRNIARDTLMKILQSLGASYFGFVLHELQATLKRGYQLHILGFTVWHLLHNLTSNLKPGDLDSCLPSIVQVSWMSTLKRLFSPMGHNCLVTICR